MGENFLKNNLDFVWCSERCGERIPTRWGVITTRPWIRPNRWISKMSWKKSYADCQSVRQIRTCYAYLLRSRYFFVIVRTFAPSKVGNDLSTVLFDIVEQTTRTDLWVWHHDLTLIAANRRTYFFIFFFRRPAATKHSKLKSKHLSTRVEEGARKVFEWKLSSTKIFAFLTLT